ncbi:MAG: hypothetical protein HQK99_11675 [Nitrospirae bacterium]|nr:hypothetical protein [Nitrospirota bacterium]
MEDTCYIKDPKTGKFLGRKPGCTNSKGETSEKLLQKVDKDKGAIERRVEAAAASGTLQRQDSPAKDKAEELARAVNSGKMSYPEALYELTKGSRSSGRYGRAIDLLDRDASYWNGIRSKTGSDEVDTLIGGYAGAPVPGATDFALNLSGGKSGMQEISDNKPLNIPSGKTREQVKAEHDKWREDIKKRAVNYDKYKDKFTDDKYTKYSGNTMETNATFYNLHNSITSNGDKYDKYSFTGAMQPIDAGKLHGGKYEYAKVTNTVNGKSVIIKINDCGPRTPIKVKGQKKPLKMLDPTKALDLSVAAYSKITHDDGKGVLRVKIEFLSKSQGQTQYDQQMRETDQDALRKRVDKISPKS